MDRKEALKAVTKADEIAEILEHVGWQDNLKASLLKLREAEVKQLVNATLGNYPRTDQRPEQAAGIIHGIDFLITTIEKALVKGDRAHYEIQKAISELEFERKE